MTTLFFILAIVQGPTLNLTPMPSGLFKRIGGYMPFGTKLSATKPNSITKAPPGDLHYGTVTVGGHPFVIALGGEKLYADTNGDGDLTNDPAGEWTLNPSKNGQNSYHSGSFTLDVPIQGQTVACHFGAYETGQPDDIGYYADFALSGKIDLGGQSYDAIYNDPYGLFDGTKGVLMVDKDRDGTFHPGYEFYSVDKPFNIAGTTYEMKSVDGKPAIVKSATTIPERTKANSVPTDPNLANGLVAGKKALPFKAITTRKRAVSFPTSYKGKIVLVDFWATWCGPCMREAPNVVKNYKAFHSQGFEVLGVSLDREKAEDQIKSVTAKQGMVWDQIYDGKFFDAAIAKQYKIQAIPATYLVDGDTGKILAAGDAARGENLQTSIAKALKAKKR